MDNSGGYNNADYNQTESVLYREQGEVCAGSRLKSIGVDEFGTCGSVPRLDSHFMSAIREDRKGAMRWIKHFTTTLIQRRSR